MYGMLTLALFALTTSPHCQARPLLPNEKLSGFYITGVTGLIQQLESTQVKLIGKYSFSNRHFLQIWINHNFERMLALSSRRKILHSYQNSKLHTLVQYTQFD
jgi:hypothetical protein